MSNNKNSGKSTKAVPTQYDPAEEVEKIASKLIAKHHTHLASCNIAYLFVNREMKKSGRVVVATAEKISKKQKALSKFDFLITVGFPTWQELSEPIRLAVVDHELSHCWVEDDEKTGETKYRTLPHEVEEFTGVLRRHGLYTVDLVKLGNVVQDSLKALSKDVVVKKLGDPEGKQTKQPEVKKAKQPEEPKVKSKDQAKVKNKQAAPEVKPKIKTKQEQPKLEAQAAGVEKKPKKKMVLLKQAPSEDDEFVIDYDIDEVEAVASQ